MQRKNKQDQWRNQLINQLTFNVKDDHQDHATNHSLQLHAKVPDSTLQTFKT
jgi:hypothetical protein